MAQSNWYQAAFSREMNRAISNLQSLDKKLVPRAAAASANKMARAVRKNTIARVSQRLKIPSVVLRFHQRNGKRSGSRFKLALAKEASPTATIRIGRTAIPAVRLIRRPELQRTQLPQIRRRGFIRAGQHVYGDGAFVANGTSKYAKGILKGRYQIMRRTSSARHPVEVLKIETKTAITRNAIRETRREFNANCGNYLAAELARQAKYGLKKL